MDFSTRGSQQSPAAPRPAQTFGESPAAPKSSKAKRLRDSKWGKWGTFALLVAVGLLVVAVLATVVTAKNKAEEGYVDNSKYQAVFLTNDQVYFGKVTELNGKYLALNNIYYLQTQAAGTNQQAAADNNNVSLVKLGCELHKPVDQMIINRSEVQFWENLQTDGQVANAIKQFQQQNPNGQKCSTSAGTGSTNVQGTTGTPTTNTETDSNP